MAKKDLDTAIQEILEDYDKGVIEDMQSAVKAAARAGLREVKSNSNVFKGTGKYSKGWKSKVETGRLTASGVIYNAALPGLPHLLEHGHAKRGGGRVAGRVHLAPVQEKLEQEFFREMEKRV